MFHPGHQSRQHEPMFQDEEEDEEDEDEAAPHYVPTIGTIFISLVSDWKFVSKTQITV